MEETIASFEFKHCVVSTIFRPYCRQGSMKIQTSPFPGYLFRPTGFVNHTLDSMMPGIVAYLHDLGMSDVYASPTKARSKVFTA
jgi:hypothetical protein